MRSLRLFLSIFLLSFWVMLLGSFLFAIAFESREGGVKMPMAGVAIRPETGFAAIDLPNRIFTCTETTSQQEQCQATIQGRPLVVTIEQASDAGITYDCQAQYDGQPVDCKNVGEEYAPMLSPSLEVTGLALDPQAFQRVRQKYWITQTMMKAGEPRLLRISGVFSFLGGVISAYLVWFHPNRFSQGLAGVTVGSLVYQPVRIFLGSVLFTSVAPYGFTVESWMQAISFGAISAGVGTAVTVYCLLRRRSRAVMKLVVTLGSGVGAMCILSYVFLLLLCGSGFVD